MPCAASSQPRGPLFAARLGWPASGWSPQQLETGSSSKNGLLPEYHPCAPVAATLLLQASPACQDLHPRSLRRPRGAASEAQRGSMIQNASRGRAGTSSTDPIQGRPYHVLPRQVQSKGCEEAPRSGQRRGQRPGSCCRQPPWLVPGQTPPAGPLPTLSSHYPDVPIFSGQLAALPRSRGRSGGSAHQTGDFSMSEGHAPFSGTVRLDSPGVHQSQSLIPENMPSTPKLPH